MGDSGLRSTETVDLFDLEGFFDLSEDHENTFETLRSAFREQLDLSLKAVGLANRSEWLSLFPEELRGRLNPPAIDELYRSDWIIRNESTWCAVKDSLGFMGAFVFEGHVDEAMLSRLRKLGPFLLSYFRRVHEFESASLREVVDVPSHPFFSSDDIQDKRGMQQIFQSSVDSIARIFECDNCRLFWRESPETLRLRAESNSTSDLDTELVISNDPVIERVITEGKSVLINDLPNSDESLRLSPRVKSFLSVPVQVDGRVMGALNLSSTTPDVFTREDLERFSAICDHLSTVYTATEELSDLTRYVDKVLDELPVGVLTYQIRQDDIQLNPEARKIMGVDREEMSRETFEKVVRETFEDPGILEIFDLDRDPDDVDPNRYELNREENYSARVVQVLQSSLRDNEKILTGKLVVLSDVTEQVRLNEQVNRTERLAALGELASSLAHEIKNPLTSIHGFVQMLPDRTDDEAFVEKTARILDRECRRLDELIENLQSYAKPQLGQRKQFDLSDVVEETLSLIRKELEKNDVDLVEEHDDNLTIYGDPSKIKQVIMNLCLNAMEAMEDGGILTIGWNEQGEDFGEFYVKDTGDGMTPDQLDKIYNPFYTTKDEGTGLGMAITHRIIEEHAGYIKIESSPGEGTTVRVAIPRSEEVRATSREVDSGG